MTRSRRWLCLGAGLLATLGHARPLGVEQQVLLSDFEAADPGWGFTRGEEFAGAQGAMRRDETVAHGGRASLRLETDFSQGGVYCAVRRDVPRERFRDVTAVRFWLRAENASGFTLQLVDATGQCHQRKLLPIAAGAAWQEVVIPVATVVGGEHWGGANDAVWHGPLQHLAVSFEQAGRRDHANPKSTLWLDDVSLMALVPALALRPVVLGNVFGAAEPVRLGVDLPVAGITRLSWQATDMFGATVAHGEQLPAPQLTVPLERLGWCSLTVTAWQREQAVDSATTSVARLADHDFTGVSRSPFGICAHFGQGYATDIIPLVARAGIKEVRDDVAWGDLERTKGTFTWPPRYDGFVQALADQHIGAHLNLLYANRLYDGGNAPYTSEGFDAFARYAAAMVQHFPTVKSFEVWNEWNSPGFCAGPAASKPDVYRELIQRTAAAVRQARPEARIVGCSTTGLWWGGYLWLERYLGLPQPLAPMDALSVHPYNCDLAPEYLTESMTRLRGMMTAATGRTVPLWVTEVGWPVNTDPAATAEQVYAAKSSVVTEPVQALYLVRTHVLLLAAGVERVHWYDLLNDGTDPKSGEANFGLLRNPSDSQGRYTPKPAYAAYAAMTRQLTDATFERAEVATGSLRSYQFRRGGQPLRVVWTLQPGSARIAATGPVMLADLMGNPRELTPANGEVVLPLPTGVPVYLVGPVTSVSPAALVTLPSTTSAALGEALSLPYEVTNAAAQPAEVTLTLDGQATAVTAAPKVPARGTLPLGLPTTAGTSEHTCLVSIDGVTVDRRTITATVEPAISLAHAPDLPNPRTLVLTLRNASRTNPFKLNAIDWQLGDASGHLPLTDSVPAAGMLDVTIPGLAVQPYASLPFEATVRFGARDPFTAQATVSYNPCPTRTPTIDGNLDEWQQQPAVDLSRCTAVKLKELGGAADLSGQVWVAHDAGHFYLAAAITDDKHVQPFAEDAVWQGDSLQFGVGDGLPWASQGLYELNVALTAKGPDVYLSRAARGEKTGELTSAVCRIVREGNVTRYELAVPLRDVALFNPAKTSAVGFSLLVNDNDGDGRKGWLEWGSGLGLGGKHPAKFNVLRLLP